MQSELSEHIVSALGEKIHSVTHGPDMLCIVTGPSELVEVLLFLRDDTGCRFISFIDAYGVDYPGREKRFDVVYQLLSPYYNTRIKVKVQTDAGEPIPSVVSVFPGANWFEREAYDLFGILFSGHPDLRRILTDYGFEGHPLRKDFPLTGFVEVVWDDDKDQVVYKPVALKHDFRDFAFLSPWVEVPGKSDE